jgi:hypothetical protein
MKSRNWWSPSTTENFEEANFVWTSWKREKHITFLQKWGSNSNKK